jgi:hypothetical protein
MREAAARRLDRYYSLGSEAVRKQLVDALAFDLGAAIADIEAREARLFKECQESDLETNRAVA